MQSQQAFTVVNTMICEDISKDDQLMVERPAPSIVSSCCERIAVIPRSSFGTDSTI